MKFNLLAVLIFGMVWTILDLILLDYPKELEHQKPMLIRFQTWARWIVFWNMVAIIRTIIKIMEVL